MRARHALPAAALAALLLAACGGNSHSAGAEADRAVSAETASALRLRQAQQGDR
jgi:uncharacterized lipoprotein